MSDVGKRQTVYDAVIYVLGATLAELAKTEVRARLAEQIHIEYGKHLAEYLRRRGISWVSEGSPNTIVESIVKTFLEQLEFGVLEQIEPTPDRGNKGVWRDLLGHQAYEELSKRYKDPFLSCPLNAVIRHELEGLGYTLVVHGCASDYSCNILESWEEVRPGKRFLNP
jgi:hypothetical protein